MNTHTVQSEAGLEHYGDSKTILTLTHEQLEHAKHRFWVEVQAREYERAGLQCGWLPKAYRKKHAIRTRTVPDGELLAG